MTWTLFEILPTHEGERWCPIRDWEDRYAVSNLGRIARYPQTTVRRGGIMSPTDQGEGYLYIQLQDHVTGRYEGHTVHKLVCRHHVAPQPASGYHVNHINGDKHDNRASNLEWVLPCENRCHDGLMKMIDRHGEKKTRQVLDRWISVITEQTESPF